MAAGDFSASQLADIQIGLQEMFEGARFAGARAREIGTINCLAEHQTAKVINDLTIDCPRDVDVYFIKDCDETVTDCEQTPPADCQITGVEAETAILTISPDMCFSKAFQVNHDLCNNALTYETLVAERMAHAMASIEQEVNRAAVAFLEANAQDNQDPSTTGGTEVGTETQIPAAEWDANLIAEMALEAQYNDIFNGFMVTGKNFWVADFTSRYSEDGCCVLKGLYDGAFDICFDPLNVDTVTGSDSTFIVDPDAYVFFGRTQYSNDAPVAMGDQFGTWYWRQRAPRLKHKLQGGVSPVYFDVVRQRTCIRDGGRRIPVDVFEVSFKGDLVLAPDICDSGLTGILHYVAT